MVRQNGTPNRSLGGEQESSKLKSRYAASRGEAHMFKPSNIRERHALRIASRAATLANVAIEETIGAAWIVRSGEHTSELQSLMRSSYAVFCLKKKSTQYNYTRSQLKITYTTIQVRYV